MKLGCCVNMVAEDALGTGISRLPNLMRFGYDYVELPIAQLAELGDSDFRELTSLLDSLSLPCECCNNFFPANIRLTGEDVDIAARDDYIKRMADKLGALGARVVVFGSGKAKNVPDGFSHERAYEQIIDALTTASDILRPQGTIIAVEPLNRHECNIINTSAEGLKLARDIGLSNVKLLLDLYHMFVEDEDMTILAQAEGMLWHIHLAMTEARRFPRPGDMDCSIILSLLKSVRYDGRISIEAYTNDFAADARAARSFLRGLWDNI